MAGVKVRRGSGVVGAGDAPCVAEVVGVQGGSNHRDYFPGLLILYPFRTFHINRWIIEDPSIIHLARHSDLLIARVTSTIPLKCLGLRSPPAQPPLWEPEERLPRGLRTLRGQAPEAPSLKSNLSIPGAKDACSNGISSSQLFLATSSRSCLQLQTIIITLDIKIRGLGRGIGQYCQCVHHGPQLAVGSAFASVAGQSGFWHLSPLLCATGTRAPASPLLRPSGHSQGRGTGPSERRCEAPSGPWERGRESCHGTIVLVLSDPWSGFPHVLTTHVLCWQDQLTTLRKLARPCTH